jgi:hypothetical protein
MLFRRGLLAACLFSLLMFANDGVQRFDIWICHMHGLGPLQRMQELQVL